MLNKINLLTEEIIGCAIRIHRELGPGLLESTYEAALSMECADSHLNFARQKEYPVFYKERPVGMYRVDMVVEDTVLVEVKSVERFQPLFEAQVLAYLRVTGLKVGLLINFNSRLLTEGIKRYVL